MGRKKGEKTEKSLSKKGGEQQTLGKRPMERLIASPLKVLQEKHAAWCKANPSRSMGEDMDGSWGFASLLTESLDTNKVQGKFAVNE